MNSNGEALKIIARSSNLDQSRPSVSRFMQIRTSTRRSINLYNLADSSPCVVTAIQISHVNTYSDVKGSLGSPLILFIDRALRPSHPEIP